MTLLIIGVLLWAGAHFFKRVAPDLRASMGDKGKGLVAVLLVVSIVLMVIGYRSMDEIYVWSPPSWGIHLNNLLILVAIFLMSPAPKKGKLFNWMRHPMLAGFRAWAAAHLLVNGDLASIILFGGLFAWAFVQTIVINRAEPEWAPDASGSIAKDGMFLVASVVLMVVIGLVHGWLGYPVFPG
ncbi:hypothetical protein FAP39_00725 [Shimia litoralis]|uniref:NnrU domain-containing protein n=1 Tax=Shimia litoralis TaxID=420403 RepID=A0A4U7N9C5_9RHOB|nr:NnrU family protein [Shimia litoralis]TKZ22428.1 hypothetical protein FAP39_00725 [Shimia litoralis]